MKRRSLLALLVSPLVSPLLKRASGACSPKKSALAMKIKNEPFKSVFDGPFKTESCAGQMTLEDLRWVREKMEKVRVPQFRGHYWFDLKKNDWMGTEDFKDLIENERKVVR